MEIAERSNVKKIRRPGIFGREPVLTQGLVMAFLNFLLAFGVVSLTDAQVGSINMLLAALIGFVVRDVVTPLARPRDNEGKDLTRM